MSLSYNEYFCFSDGGNHALHKSALQSTTFPTNGMTNDASKAVDGNAASILYDVMFLHLHEIVEGLYFQCSLSLCLCLCLSVCQ